MSPRALAVLSGLWALPSSGVGLFFFIYVIDVLGYLQGYPLTVEHLEPMKRLVFWWRYGLVLALPFPILHLKVSVGLWKRQLWALKLGRVMAWLGLLTTINVAYWHVYYLALFGTPFRDPRDERSAAFIVASVVAYYVALVVSFRSHATDTATFSGTGKDSTKGSRPRRASNPLRPGGQAQ